MSISQTDTGMPDKKSSRSRSERTATSRDAGASGSESSIPEEVPTGTGEDKHKVGQKSLFLCHKLLLTASTTIRIHKEVMQLFVFSFL